MSYVHINSLKERWAGLVGRVILAFGEIELSILECLIDVPNENLYPQYKDEEFHKKANKAIQVLNDSSIEPKLRRKMVKLINLAMQKAKDRNLVAHNPLHLGFYTDMDGSLDFRYEIRSLRRQEVFMTLRELETLALDIEQLAGNVYETMSAISFNKYT